MGRSRGRLTSKIHALVDMNGMPVRLALTAGEAHDNRLAGELLSRLKSGTMLLADRSYDADWIRALAADRGAWANIPPRSNRNDRSASARTSTVPATWSSGSSTRSNSVGGSLLATTSLRPTTSPSSSWHQYGYGCVLMSPRPNQIGPFVGPPAKFKGTYAPSNDSPVSSTPSLRAAARIAS